VIAGVAVATLFASYAVLSLTYRFMVQKLFEHLKKHRAGTWEQLGKPWLFSNTDLLANRAFQNFIRGSQRQQPGDTETVRLARSVRRLQSAWLANVGALLVAFVWLVTTHQA
jgi:hypothetical protein